MGKGEEIICCEYRLSLQGVLSGHPEAANPAGQLMVKGDLTTFHFKMRNVYKAMSHVVLFQGSIVCKGIQLPTVISEYLKYLYLSLKYHERYK